jgi:hypothetical protein
MDINVSITEAKQLLKYDCEYCNKKFRREILVSDNKKEVEKLEEEIADHFKTCNQNTENYIKLKSCPFCGKGAHLKFYTKVRTTTEHIEGDCPWGSDSYDNDYTYYDLYCYIDCHSKDCLSRHIALLPVNDLKSTNKDTTEKCVHEIESLISKWNIRGL